MPAAATFRRLAPALLLAALSGPGWAQTAVSLQGMLGQKALLIVNGSAPRAVAPGETHQGVKVLSTRSDQATVLVDGQRLNLRVGDAPASVGASSQAGRGGDRVVLSSDGRGHFFADGRINNRQTRFMVDTGATQVGISREEADRLGLRYSQGAPVRVSTANGVAQGWRVRLDELRLGDVVVYGVDAIVTPQPMPYILLGNSVLNRFDMQRSGDQMTLRKR